MLKSKKFWKRLILILIIIPIILFSTVITIVYWKQDAIIQELIATLNKDFKGEIEIKDSHVSPFANFPYISIDLEGLKIYENKKHSNEKPIVRLNDVYVGFDLMNIIKGNYEIKSIKLQDGNIKIVQYKNGDFNIAKAFEPIKPIEEVSEELHLDLKTIKLENVDISKLNLENNLLVDAYIDKATSKFRTTDDNLLIGLDSKFQLSLIKNGDTTFIKHKHFEVETEFNFNEKSQLLTISPTEVKLERAVFQMSGMIDVDDDLNLDLKFSGDKPNFDLFLAMAPEELEPVLKRYDNKGRVYFNATVKGKSINGHQPLINADFGCKNAFFKNTTVNRKLDEINFKGHFTNGEKRNTSTMEFGLDDFSAKPEAGVFSGHLIVKNFDSPEIDMKLISRFDLDFLSKFFNLNDLSNLKGKVKLTMNFKDIIDLNNPEKSIEKLNESYYSELEVKNLSFATNSYHLPIKNVNIKAVMDGHFAKIEHFDLKIGQSDLSIKGSVSDLPAIIHHTGDIVDTKLLISSKVLDLKELTSTDPKNKKPFDERIEDFSMKLGFKSSAKAFTESPNLPVGEFFIEDLYAKLKHYPHTLHDFHADVFVDDQNFKIVDFSGMIDKSDFHFNGKLLNYNLWFDEKMRGDTKIEFALNSKLLQLEDLFAYGGENFVPEDYRHEEFKDLKLHGFADLHFKEELKSMDINLDKFYASMKIHPMRMESFKGRIHVEDEHIVLQKFQGKIGKSSFIADMNYYYGNDKKVRKRDNHLTFKSPYLDFDQLMNYNPMPTSKNTAPIDHDAVFSIYDFPFTDMSFDVEIDHLNYHKYLLHNIKTKMRMQDNHFIYFDKLHLAAAGGEFDITGYLSGNDKKHIYFKPDIKIKHVDLDKLMLKFDNFGQDHLVSENLHGKFSGRITGKIHMHADLVPKLDDSEIHIDVEVLGGKLENFGPMEILADYFKDKNVSKVIFDTLSNHLDMKNGTLNIPRMTINTSLGFIEVEGKQDMNMKMEYYISVPWKMITGVGKQKLFGGKKDVEHDTEVEDQIVYKDANKKVRYLNLKLVGDAENYKISIAKKKKGTA
jgi:hypothetical protein